MQKTKSSRWLSADEASALLQSFMPHKAANDWLDTDRKSSPAIPFWYRDGEVRYRSTDLEFFVSHCLAPGVQVDFSERRQRRERRRMIERRQNPSIRLSPVAERRRAHDPDRRGMYLGDRRTNGG